MRWATFQMEKRKRLLLSSICPFSLGYSVLLSTSRDPTAFAAFSPCFHVLAFWSQLPPVYFQFYSLSVLSALVCQSFFAIDK